MEIVWIILHILLFVAGLSTVMYVLFSAVRTFVVPRSASDRLTNTVFRTSWVFFRTLLRRRPDYFARDQVMVFFAPITLFILPGVWLVLVWTGYTAMFWGLGVDGISQALKTSGSSLFTLGFIALDDLLRALVAFSEAAIGLALLALLIAYLPTIYSSFSRRELAVSLLEVRAGSPPSAEEMVVRFHRLQRLHLLHDIWETWETWFVDIDESHTSLAMLVFFRSPQPERSWVVAAGTVLDAAALVGSTIDIPHDAQADLTLRAGYIALRHIADYFRISYNPKPKPNDPISLSRADFDATYDRLQAEGVPLKPDRDQAWRDFAGWRVNYDAPLLALAELTMAPDAPWLSEKSRKRGLILGGRMVKSRPFTNSKRKSTGYNEQ